MYTYPIESRHYSHAEIVGSYKAILFEYAAFGARRLKVAQVGEEWWFCKDDWSVNDQYNTLSLDIGNQLNQHCAQYLVDLIVGVSPITQRNRDA